MGSSVARDWVLRPPDSVHAEQLAAAIGVPRLTATLLLNRGLREPEAARSFLAPALRDLEDPFVLTDMDRAADRIALAMRRKERIVIYGDYDVDGMTGTALLLNFFRFAGVPARHYIPSRLDDGYGITETGIAHFAAERSAGLGPDVLITVDHGVTAVDGIARIADLGIDVIVTDHHEPGAALPERAAAIVNPRRPGCPSRTKHLCGVAVAFKLVWAASRRFTRDRRESNAYREFLLEALAFVGLGTIADVMPLTGDNRILARHGLAALAATTRPGLAALRRSARLDRNALSATDVAFRLVPRLNAASRMGRQELAVELLTTDSEARAIELAGLLDRENQERQRIEAAMVEDATRLLRTLPRADDDPVVLWSRDWHAGVIGILAARIVDLTGAPAIMISLRDGIGKGSARSAGDVSIHAAIGACAPLLLSFGGHRQAAGLTVPEAKLESLREALCAAVRAQRTAPGRRPALKLDAEIPFAAVDGALAAELSALEPFGEGNPSPAFLTRGVHLASEARTLGRDGRHATFDLTRDGRRFRALAFNHGRRLAELRTGVPLSVAWVLGRPSFGRSAPELEILDFRIGDPERLVLGESPAGTAPETAAEA